MREGFARKDDTLPERMENEPLRSGKTAGKSVSKASFETMLSEYYGLWGWDDQGRPTRATLQDAGLGEIVTKLPYLK